MLDVLAWVIVGLVIGIVIPEAGVRRGYGVSLLEHVLIFWFFVLVVLGAASIIIWAFLRVLHSMGLM